ncbi:phage portal protein [Candidatus Poribacteria bacterium]
MHWLHYQRNHERLSNYSIYDGYYNGDHEISIPPKVKLSLQSELGTVNNYCRVVVDTSVDYICGGETGIQVISGVENQEKASKAEALLYDVYESNQLLYEEMLKTVTVMGKKGDVFLKLYIDNNQIKVRALRPDICFPRYKSDDYKEMLYCAIKWFDDEEAADNISPSGWGTRRKWKAQVFRPDVVEYYELGETAETEYSQWELVDVQKNLLGFIPIIHIKNTVDDLEFGVSDLQVMTDLQDALNKTITDMLLTMDNQAFQRMFIFGGQTPKGHEISMEPGMITEVPNENGTLEVVQAADITSFIQALREIVDQICTVTSTPRMAFSRSESGPVSGYALRLHYVPLERKCGKKKIILRNRFGELNRMIFAAARLLGMGSYTDFGTRMQFTGGLPIDEEAQMQIHEMELRNKVKSRWTVMQERGIVDVDTEILRIRIDSE